MSIDAPIDTRPLRCCFAGSVIAPDDAGWDEARQAFNLALDQRPALVAVAQDARDVAAAVRFAAERGLRVAPQATGHNAQPLGDLSGSILLKTHAMTGFSVDAERRTARVEAGTKWGPVCDAISPHGLAPLSGSARDVGVVGYTLGGGLGWLARQHGLNCNKVTAVELVTAEGEEIRATADHEPDLFWALRGAGHGFGVVTALELELVPAPQLYAGSLFFPFERAAEILHAWREWTRTVPDAVTSTAKLLQLPPLPEIPEPLRGGSFALVQMTFLGGEAEGAALLEPLRALGPAIDTFAMVEPLALSYLAMDPEDPMPYLSASALLGDVPAVGIDALLEAAGPGSGSTLAAVELRQLGGALSRTHDDHGVRDTLPGSYLTFAAAPLMDPAQAPDAQAQLDRVRRSTAMYEIGQYVNFAETGTAPEQLFGEQPLGRLRALKAQWDPRGTIHANHPVTA